MRHRFDIDIARDRCHDGLFFDKHSWLRHEFACRYGHADEDVVYRFICRAATILAYATFLRRCHCFLSLSREIMMRHATTLDAFISRVCPDYAAAARRLMPRYRWRCASAWRATIVPAFD